MSTVSLIQLNKNFKEISAVSDFNIFIEDKEFVVLVGPSGCGKSTTLRMIAGHEVVSDGEILIDSLMMNNLEPANRPTAMMFQDYALFPHLNCLDNVAFSLKMRGMKKMERYEKSRSLLELVHMENYENRLPSQLSGGQQQRAAIARALCMEPRALLLDEPTSALDPELQQEVIKVIKDLAAEDRTMILVTHDMSLARDVSDHVIFLHQGKIEEQGPPAELFVNPETQRLQQFLSATIAA